MRENGIHTEKLMAKVAIQLMTFKYPRSFQPTPHACALRIHIYNCKYLHPQWITFRIKQVVIHKTPLSWQSFFDTNFKFSVSHKPLMLRSKLKFFCISYYPCTEAHYQIYWTKGFGNLIYDPHVALLSPSKQQTPSTRRNIRPIHTLSAAADECCSFR